MADLGHAVNQRHISTSISENVSVSMSVSVFAYIYFFLMEGLLGNIRDDCGFLSYTLKSPQDVK